MITQFSLRTSAAELASLDVSQIPSLMESMSLYTTSSSGLVLKLLKKLLCLGLTFGLD